MYTSRWRLLTGISFLKPTAVGLVIVEVLATVVVVVVVVTRVLAWPGWGGLGGWDWACAWASARLPGVVIEPCIFTGGSRDCWPYSIYCAHKTWARINSKSIHNASNSGFKLHLSTEITVCNLTANKSNHWPLPPASGEETAENGQWRPSADNTVGSPSIYTRKVSSQAVKQPNAVCHFTQVSNEYYNMLSLTFKEAHIKELNTWSMLKLLLPPMFNWHSSVCTRTISP